MAKIKSELNFLLTDMDEISWKAAVSLWLWEAWRRSGYEHRPSSQRLRMVLGSDLICVSCLHTGETMNIPVALLKGFSEKLENYHHKLLSYRTLQLEMLIAQSYFSSCCLCHRSVFILSFPCSVASSVFVGLPGWALAWQGRHTNQ